MNGWAKRVAATTPPRLDDIAFVAQLAFDPCPSRPSGPVVIQQPGRARQGDALIAAAMVEVTALRARLAALESMWEIDTS